jgi:hypothetical protein
MGTRNGFSDVPDPVMFRWFLGAANYWFGYSDTSTIEDCDPARERFTVGIDDVVDGVNVMGPAMDKTHGLGDELHLRPGTYKIRYEDGRVVTNAWNIEHL